MTRPSDAIGAFEMLAVRNEWGGFQPDAARQILAYIKDLEDTNAKWVEWNEHRKWINSLSDYHYP